MTLLPNTPLRSTVQYNSILAPLYHLESLIRPDSEDNNNNNACEHNFEHVDLEATSEDMVMVNGTNSFINYNDNNTPADACQRLEKFISLSVKAHSAGMWSSILNTPRILGPQVCIFGMFLCNGFKR